MHDIRTEVQQCKEQTASAMCKTNEVHEKGCSLERERDKLNCELLELRAESMRDNLVFFNIPEVCESDDNGKVLPESTEELLRNFLLSKMKIAEDCIRQMSFERVHWSEPLRNNPRKIMAKFSSLFVLSQAY